MRGRCSRGPDAHCAVALLRPPPFAVVVLCASLNSASCHLLLRCKGVLHARRRRHELLHALRQDVEAERAAVELIPPAARDIVTHLRDTNAKLAFEALGWSGPLIADGAMVVTLLA